MSGAKTQQIEVDLTELHAAQERIVTESRRWNVLACGRRFGKTTLGINLDAYPALEGYPVGWYSPTHKMLTEVWREMVIALRPVTSRKDASEHRLELITGGVIDMWSLDSPDSSRGRKYKRVVVDEAAMVKNFQEAWQAVIRPTLTDYQGDAYWLSTPRGMNYFKQGFDNGQDKTMTEWASWHMPTSSNPFISKSEIEAARLELPEMTFRQEYLAEFLQNEGAVFRNIEANLTAEHSTPEQHKGHRIVMGVDWAQKYDFTVLSAGCVQCKAEVDFDRFNKIEWAFQRARLRTMADRWKVAEILAEENSIGGPNIEALQGEGLPVKAFTTTAQSKPPLIQSLALSLEREEMAFLPDPVGKAELLAYESKVNANTGRISYSAPDGMHDDTVMARALMLHCMLIREAEMF
jgi:phage terminase large subunit-like protein